jgi:copper homeostasis protein
MPLLEVCVDSLEALRAAEEGGAARIELCSRLDLGGLSPTPELAREALAVARLPIAVMVRPRAGGFVYTPDDLAAMEAEIVVWREARPPQAPAAIVFGALTKEGDVDVSAVRRLLAAARPRNATFHRAFDEVRDPARALEALVRLGVDRVLTSGGAPDAHAGRHSLRALVERSRGRIVVMAGGGVRSTNAADLLAASGVTELHGSVPFRFPAT